MNFQTDKIRLSLFSVVVGIVFLAVNFPGMAMADNYKSGQKNDMESVELEHYVLRAGPIKIGNFFANASGLTYNPLTRSLFLVNNRPAKIIELGLDGSQKRAITLPGFHDTEGITHIKDNTFAVVEERRRNICIFEIDRNTTTIDRAKADIITVDPTPDGNKGLEGVSYDPDRGRFYVVKEKDPRIIYQFPWPTKSTSFVDISHPWNIQNKSLSLKDLSDVYYHPGTGNLLFLSDESASVVETTAAGKELGRLSLKKGGATGLQKHVKQAEGITMDSKGVLFIISEPNLLYVFDKPSAAKLEKLRR